MEEKNIKRKEGMDELIDTMRNPFKFRAPRLKVYPDYEHALFQFEKEYDSRLKTKKGKERAIVKKVGEVFVDWIAETYGTRGPPEKGWKEENKNSVDPKPYIERLDKLTTSVEKEDNEKLYCEINVDIKNTEIFTGYSTKYIRNPNQIIGGRASGTNVGQYNPKTVLHVYDDDNGLEKIIFSGIAPIGDSEDTVSITAKIPASLVKVSEIWGLSTKMSPQHFSNGYDHIPVKENYPEEFMEEYNKRYIDAGIFRPKEFARKITDNTKNITYLQ